MKTPLAFVTLIGGMLALMAFVVEGGRDTSVFVPPPDAVAEGFLRAMAAGRSEQAFHLVDPDAGVAMDSVTTFSHSLRARAGRVGTVEAESRSIGTTTSEAAAVLETEKAGRIRVVVSFARRRGLWRVVHWQEE